MLDRSLERQRGFVLLVALGVLGVLGLLAATFATLSRVERAVSNSYVDKVRAKMLAQSGVERAIASIRGRSMVQAWDDQRNDWYYREALNAEGGGILYPASVKANLWKFTPTRAYGMPPKSLESVLDDGIVNGTANGISFPQSINTTTNEPFSGQFPGTYESRGDVYALKVLDCASMINVNDGGGQIVRVLDNLGSILMCSDGSRVDAGGFKLGTSIFNRVKTVRKKPFNNKSEIFTDVFLTDPILSGNPANARLRFEAVKDFITCHGWVDGMTTRFVNTWVGLSGPSNGTNWYKGDYTFATTGVAGGGGGSGSGSGSGGGIFSGSGGGKGGFSGSGGGKGGFSGSGGGILIGPPILIKGGGFSSGGGSGAMFKAGPSVPEFATSPLFSISLNAPGVYATIPSTTRILAVPPPKARISGKGGGFAQFPTGYGKPDTVLGILGGETVNGKFGTSYLTEPRTPVNINTASMEVLVATLMNLEADFWDYEVLNENPVGGARKEYTNNLVNVNVKITQPDAEKIAAFLISARFTNGIPAGAWSFNDWMHFEDDQILKIPGLTRFQMALIKANANPNSNIKKMCPDLILITSNPSIQPEDLVRMDKSDVKVPSTEWTFSSNGLFEIESVGRVYSSGKIMAEEKIETVVKVFDQVVYTNQEQFETDRTWTADDPAYEGDLLANGYPPVVSMPEYVYNIAGAPVHYRSQTGDVTWCADYEGYMVLNGPAKVQAGDSPVSSNLVSANSESDETKACWGSDPGNQKLTPVFPAAKPCGVSFVAGFNMGTIYPSQSHRNAFHLSPGTPQRHPEYSYDSPACHGKPGYSDTMHAGPLHSGKSDSGYTTGYGEATVKSAYQIQPSTSGCNFWDDGGDLQNFGIYINEVRRNRFCTYWADEVPAPNCTIEMTVKPEIDIYTWATNSKPHQPYGTWTILPCKRQVLFDWGTVGTAGMNYQIRGYAELSRVYGEFTYRDPISGAMKLYVMWMDHYWKPHTWHHVEWSWVGAYNMTNPLNAAIVTVPANAMLFVDGATNPEGASSMFSPDVDKDLNTKMGFAVVTGAAMILPFNVHPTNPSNNYGQGPRFDVGGILANDGSYGMSSPRWHGLIDNIIMHHWRAHSAAFTNRNRYHSTTYYDGVVNKGGVGSRGETAGVYKKELTYLEGLANAGPLTIGTVGCAHYHPFHVHLYGHDGSAPTTSFGHITPLLRIVPSSGSVIDATYYDGCVGVGVVAPISPGTKLYYIGWFEVASMVPVTFSPILCDIKVTYFQEPQTLYRLSSSEAKK